MALSERSRSTIYQTFEPMLGEEVIGEMLSHFPARDAEEPATKEFVRAEVADVRTEIAGVRAEIAQLRTELLVTMHDEFRRQLQWLVGTLVVLTGVMLAGVRLFAA
jgi:hypothetical protein